MNKTQITNKLKELKVLRESQNKELKNCIYNLYDLIINTSIEFNIKEFKSKYESSNIKFIIDTDFNNTSIIINNKKFQKMGSDYYYNTDKINLTTDSMNYKKILEDLEECFNSLLFTYENYVKEIENKYISRENTIARVNQLIKDNL